MSKTIAIFAAGTGLGISTARRFGRAGYQVAWSGGGRMPPRTEIAGIDAASADNWGIAHASSVTRCAAVGVPQRARRPFFAAGSRAA